MSALAQLIELRGTPTVVLALVRVQIEKVRPPRGLWTTFQLGRPMGEPGGKELQHRVLRQALSLLERTDGPVILEDFPDDDPNWTDQPGWRPPVSFNVDAKGSTKPSTPAEWEKAIAAEIAALAPHWARAQHRFGRTTVGLSCMPPEALPAFMASFLAGELPSAPSSHLAAPGLSLRFAVDDLKAYYTESAQADGGAPASRQIDGWFWRETLGGAFVQALRVAGMASENNGLKTVSGRFFVPAPWIVA